VTIALKPLKNFVSATPHSAVPRKSGHFTRNRLKVKPYGKIKAAPALLSAQAALSNIFTL